MVNIPVFENNMAISRQQRIIKGEREIKRKSRKLLHRMISILVSLMHNNQKNA